jgi:Dyp-type peroxidase family
VIAPAPGDALDLPDIQGLVLTAYSKLDQAAFLFVRLPDDVPAARGWLGELVGGVSPASELAAAERGEPRLQLALTATGLVALGAPEALDGLADEAKQGMHARARILGDGEDPAFELIPKGTRVDALVMLYAKGAEARDALAGEHAKRVTAAGGTVIATERSGRWTDHEHFGFADGMSQPTLPGAPVRAGKAPPSAMSTIPAGEILLGHVNAYGRLPKGPHSAAVDLGKNGTYLVFRKLEQDVVGFWTYFAGQARALTAAGHGPGPNATAAELDRWADWLAAKVVGRWRNGACLVDAPDAEPTVKPDPVEANRFTFRPHDTDGDACPVGSHIRRANPRDARGDDVEKSWLVVNRHRIIRRGRSYGSALPRDQAIRGDGERTGRGLLFMCLQASIARGFEFVQQTWLANQGFGGLSREIDPVAGGDTTGEFSIPTKKLLSIRLKGMPQFVRTLGGGYFFLPSLSALRHLAEPVTAAAYVQERRTRQRGL